MIYNLLFFKIPFVVINLCELNNTHTLRCELYELFADGFVCGVLLLRWTIVYAISGVLLSCMFFGMLGTAVLQYINTNFPV